MCADSENISNNTQKLHNYTGVRFYSQQIEHEFLCNLAEETLLNLHNRGTHTQKLFADTLLQDLASIRKTLSLASKDYTASIGTVQRTKLRETFRSIGNCSTMGDIQSPSFLSSNANEIIHRHEVVQDRLFDYKRSRHYNAFEAETMISELFANNDVKVFLFNSGMSSISTIFNWIASDIIESNDAVMIGTSCYYESKILSSAIFGKQCIQIDDSDTEQLISSITSSMPRVVILDSISTGLQLNKLQIKSILENLALECQHDLTIIVDNTCAESPISILNVILPPNIKLVVVESLAKYYQFGLDCVTGGIVWSRLPSQQANRLERFREYSGTNISDSSVLCIPVLQATKDLASLNIALHMKSIRMQRQSKNAQIAAEYFCKSNESQNYTIYYPKLKKQFSEADNYFGSILTIVPQWPWCSADGCRKLISNIIKSTTENDISLVAGSSFGFDITRLFPSNLDPDSNKFYLRISCGTEPEDIFKKILMIIETELHKIAE